MWRFFTFYLLLAISGLWLLKRDSLQPMIEQFCLGLAIVSGFIINLVDDSIQRTVAVLRDQETDFAIEVTVDCSALSISWLFVAGVLAYPLLNTRQKIVGILTGLLIIQSMNILRLISLVYFGSWFSFEVFDLIHAHFWPLLLHLIALVSLVWALFQTEAIKTRSVAPPY